MENAADALKMAAAMLVFITALGISIASFSQARATADILVTYSDRDYVTQYEVGTDTKTRIVGAETIIPTIFRAYNENYRIVFYKKNGENLEELDLYTLDGEGINYIDLEKITLGGSQTNQQDNFVMALLYGKSAGDKGILIDSTGATITFDKFVEGLEENNKGIDLKEEGIYATIIEGNTFEEKYGVYYQTEESTGTTSSDLDEDDYSASSTGTTENSTKKRVITYIMQ